MVKSLAVKIPKGTEDGQTLRLRGKGGPGFGGGPAGDALITVLVRPHPVFRRDGDDIVLTLPITIDEAVLGGEGHGPDHRRPGGPDSPVRAPVRARSCACAGAGVGADAGQQDERATRGSS
jgi:hypothetical protein